ncbi:hypothetical protein Tco_1529836, partial [Tanacetum coccineum]
ETVAAPKVVVRAMSASIFLIRLLHRVPGFLQT